MKNATYFLFSDIFAEQSYASNVNDEFCSLLATRQGQVSN